MRFAVDSDEVTGGGLTSMFDGTTLRHTVYPLTSLELAPNGLGAV